MSCAWCMLCQHSTNELHTQVQCTVFHPVGVRVVYKLHSKQRGGKKQKESSAFLTLVAFPMCHYINKLIKHYHENLTEPPGQKEFAMKILVLNFCKNFSVMLCVRVFLLKKKVSLEI